MGDEDHQTPKLTEAQAPCRDCRKPTNMAVGGKMTQRGMICKRCAQRMMGNDPRVSRPS